MSTKKGTKDIKINLPPAQSVFQSVVAEAVDSAVPQSWMSFHDAIHLIEGHEADNRFYEAQKVIERQLTRTTDLEEKGASYYYLLRLFLRGHVLIENKRAQNLYQKMKESFLACERKYKKDFLKTKNLPKRKIIRLQLEAFYQLVDGYFMAVERIYQEKGFLIAKARAHEDKMHFRKRFAFFSGKHFKHLGHLFLDKTSRYGHSFSRWGITVMLFVSMFAGIFALLDLISSRSMFADYIDGSGIFDYFYFSLVTFTTLGYGDIVPVTIPEKLVVGAEVLSGFVMLGIFINLIQRRL